MNNRVIVTTTINSPTKATMKLLSLGTWDIIIAGDLKTPHNEYINLQKQFPHFTYLTPDEQNKMDYELSVSIGFKCIQRRNFAFLEAYKRGYEIVGTFDDDNIIYDFWDGETNVGKKIVVNVYTHKTDPCIDPFAIIGVDYHHRGFPLEYVKNRNEILLQCGMENILVDVEAPIPEGDPDVDAIIRTMYAPNLKVNCNKLPFTSNKIMPFNSQCTFLRGELIPYYMVLTNVGRHDDILGAYLLQKLKNINIVFTKPIAYQERNPHDLTVDIKNEMFGYCNSAKYINSENWQSILPRESIDNFNRYNKIALSFKRG